MKKVIGTLFLLACAVLMMGQRGCGGSEAAKEQSRLTEELTMESNRQVGMPGIANFTEKRRLRQLYELRDQEIVTYTYIVDWQGRLFHVCDSIGFGIPFSAQYTTPERFVYRNSGSATIPQPEPNGLFPPSSSSATWVICADEGGEFRPVYVEPSIIVSPFPLKGAVASYSN